MVLSTSHQIALAFTAVLFTFVVLPRMFGVGGGIGAKEARFDPRYGRKGPGPGAMRGQPVHLKSPQSSENMQHMKKLMEQEMKSDKFKANNNKGYVFTLMPLYAIGVGVFAAYKFLKIKSADDQAQKDKFAKGAKKSADAENQLNELEQRLAQTERMLNSILTQLDPLTNCVKSVAQDQKNEIMTQLQTIRYLMKKRGMECPPLNVNEASCERNLDALIESLGAAEAPQGGEDVCPQNIEGTDEATAVAQDTAELVPEESGGEMEEEDEVREEELEEGDREEGEVFAPSNTNTEEVAEQPASGLRRRNRPE